MNRHRLRVRALALLTAYAIAVQAALSGVALTAHASDSGFTLSATCTGAPGSGQPAGHDLPCLWHCLATAWASGLVPPAVAVAALIAPAEVRASLPQLSEAPGRATEQTPQIPRAPPRA
jgi:hypothetical protein